MEPISFSESLKILQVLLERLRGSTEKIQARESIHRVLATSVHAKHPNPATAIAAMDGIAVNCMTIPDALVRLRQEQWQFINTGEVLPEKFNAVVKIEEVQWEDQIPVLDKKPNLYQNVRRIGEDFEQGALLISAENQLLPQDVSLLLAAGCEPVEVYKQPLIRFVPTGSELVNRYDISRSGTILETNSAMVGGLVAGWGGQFRVMDPVPDDPDDLAQMIKHCVKQSDVVIVSAGTSRGTKDLTAEVIRFMGTLHFHGVRISPGKPVLLGEVDGTPVLGLPGYPAAAYVCSYLYLRRLVCELSHVRFAFPRSVFISAEDIQGNNTDSFYRVNCFNVEGQIFVRKLEGGAGSIASISRMDGLMHVPPQTTIRKRDGVRIDLIHERTQNTIALKGVSDPGISHLLGLVGGILPSHRLLFWRSSAQEALDTIVERSLHIAVVGTPAYGQDPFDLFAKQLQEPMHRYRTFTRTIALLFRDTSQKELVKGMKIAIPQSHVELWNRLLEREGMNIDLFQIFHPSIYDKNVIDAFESSRWDAVFVDSRFLKQENAAAMSIQEHLDLVIPESYIELPGIRKLIEVLMSEEFWMFIETQKGCSIDHRGQVS
jgi:putative molybdopterin biosynthesis protein